MKEYRINRGAKAFIYVFAALVFGVVVWLVLSSWVPALRPEMSQTGYWASLGFTLLFAVVMVLGLKDAQKGRLQITEDTIRSSGLFFDREIRFEDVKGYRQQEKLLEIIPRDPGRKKIRISQYLERQDELKHWITTTFPDLDQVVREQEQQEILGNADFGLTAEDRSRRLSEARVVAKVLNALGIVAGGYLLLLARPYGVSLYAAILLPFLCFPVLWRYRRMVRLSARKNSAYPSVLMAIGAPAFALVLRAMIDFQVTDHSQVWLPCLLIVLLLTALIGLSGGFADPGSAQGMASVLGTAGLFALYSYGSIVTLNGYLDRHAPKVYDVTVLSRRISKGKTTSYYVTVSLGRGQSATEEISVSRSMYEKLGEQDTAYLCVMDGRFGIPWEFLRAEL